MRIYSGPFPGLCLFLLHSCPLSKLGLTDLVR